MIAMSVFVCFCSWAKPNVNKETFHSYERKWPIKRERDTFPIDRILRGSCVADDVAMGQRTLTNARAH